MKKWRIFHYDGPSEQIGIAWTYGSIRDALSMVNHPVSALSLVDHLTDFVKRGKIDGDKLEFRLKPKGTMGGKIVIVWEDDLY